MSFTFVHTADWQIGRPFRAFDDRLGGLLEEARLSAIETIAGVARKAGATHVLVAGDVFDAETLPRRVLSPAIERMARHGDVVWHLLPGNHDPARPGGLWHRLTSGQLPANLRPHVATGPVEVEPGIWLLAAPLTAKGRSSDPTAWMDGTATPAGELRIGLAHGSVYDFEGGGSSGTIDPARARKAGLVYLALGDWHGMKRISPNTWYAGTPEPDRFGDAAAGHALVVRLAGNAEPTIDPAKTGHFVWAARTAAIASLADLATLEAELIQLAPAADRLLLRLALEGSLLAEDRAGLAQWRSRLSERVRYLDVDDAGLATRAEPADIARLFADPRLAAVAERLTAMSTQGEAAQRKTAGRALAHLVEITRAGADSP